MRRALVFLIASSMAMLVPVTALAQVPGHFNVAYAHFPATSADFIHLHGWAPGSTLTISIDDPAAPGADYEISGIVAASTEGFNVPIGPAFDIKSGYIVTVSDGGSQQSLVVTNLEIRSVDLGSDLVSGVAAPGQPVMVTPDYNTTYWVDPAADGSWQVDMSAYDLTAGVNVAAQQLDANGNATQFDYYTSPTAQVSVSLFAPPVDNEAINAAQAGRTVPFKFRVTDTMGDPVLNLTDVNVIVDLGACESNSASDVIEWYTSDPGRLINGGDGYYQFNLKTDRAWAGKCGRLGVEVGSGGSRTAGFKFK